MRKSSILSFLVFFVLAPPALAEGANPSGWRFQLTPYAWGLSVDGKIGTGHRRLRKVRIEESFGDILRSVNGAFFLQASARRDRFVLRSDISWSSSSGSEKVSTPLGRLKLKGRLRHASATLVGGYSILQDKAGALDVGAGLRAWSIKTSVRSPQLAITKSRTEHWIDPVLALRGRLQFSPDWSVIAGGDIGGAGLGSRLTWQLTGSVNYRVDDAFFLSAGYRHLYLDYRRKGTRVRADFSGPLLGATLRF